MLSKKLLKLHRDNLRDGRLRSSSVLMTLMGDAVMPHGGEVWLGNLIKLAAPLGIGERLVRTSVYRLREENWLQARRIGRRSHYRLTLSGILSTRQAEIRIYHPPDPEWSGAWHLVFATDATISTRQRTELRRRMRWIGFGILAPNVYGHPVAPLGPVENLLKEMDLENCVMIMRAGTIGTPDSEAARQMAQQCCNLDTLEQEYRRFNQHYEPILDVLSKSARISNEECFILRLIMIHDYRRILLRGPSLPATLLPPAWEGHRAFRLCADIYLAIWAAAELHIDHILNTEETGGSIQKPYLDRFGGLVRGSGEGRRPPRYVS